MNYLCFNTNDSKNNNKRNNNKSNIFILNNNKVNKNKEKIKENCYHKQLGFLKEMCYYCCENKKTKKNIKNNSLVFFPFMKRYNIIISNNYKNNFEIYNYQNDFIQKIKNILYILNGNYYIKRYIRYLLDYLSKFDEEIIINIINNNESERNEIISFKIKTNIIDIIKKDIKTINIKLIKDKNIVSEISELIIIFMKNLENIFININLHKSKNNKILFLNNDNKLIKVSKIAKVKNTFTQLYNFFNNYKKSREIKDIAYNIFNNSEILLHSNNSRKKPLFIYDKIKLINSGIKINYEEILNNLVIYCSNEKNLIKNYIKFSNFLKEVENRINIEFKYDYYLKIKLNFQKGETRNNNYIYNISCKYIFYQPENNQELTFKDNNILINGINSVYQGFQYLISEINDEKYEYLIIFNGEYGSYNNRKSNLLEDSDLSDDNKIENINQSYLNNNENYKIIGKYIKQLKNGYFISYGNENNKIFIYDKYFRQKLLINSLQILKMPIINIIETNHSDFPKEESQLFICTKIDYYIINLDFKTFDYHTYFNNYFLKIYYFKYIKINKYNYLFFFKSGHIYSFGTYMDSIRINEEIVVFPSNTINKENKEKLIIFNINTKKIIQKIEVDTFSKSPNSLICIDNENINSNNKVLLCTCKYNGNKQYGILLLNINFKFTNDIKISHFFYILNFNINCLCPIKVNIQKELSINRNDNIIINTKYFLVAGANSKGKIQLYKLLFTDNRENIMIQYVKDIDIKSEINMKGIKGSFTCIFQSKERYTIISSEDGSIFFSKK